MLGVDGGKAVGDPNEGRLLEEASLGLLEEVRSIAGVVTNSICVTAVKKGRLCMYT